MQGLLSPQSQCSQQALTRGEPSPHFTEGIRLYSHSHFAITPVLHNRVKQKVGCPENSLFQGTQNPLLRHPHCYGQAGAGQRLTMSSRMSTLSRSRLFSSSSCWFRLRKRCSSLRSSRKPPDSWRKEGGQNTDCQPTVATSDQSKLSCTLPETQWPFSNFRLWPARFIVGVPYSRPSSTSRVDLSSCREKITLKSFTEFQSHPLLSYFLVTGILLENTGANGPGAWNPTLVMYCCSRALAPLTAIPAHSPTYTLISLHLETTDEFSVTQCWTAGGVMMILP